MSEVLGIFEPTTQNLRNLFDGTNYYQVPYYQRPYAWGEDEIEDLWDDIYNAFELKEEYYFLGPIILAKTNGDHYEVVDGQQRLTTLTILFSVLRDFFINNINNKAIKNQIKNAIKSMIDDKYRLRLITQEKYHLQFENEILKKVTLPKGKLIKKEKEKPKYRYINSAVILKNKIKECFGSNNEELLNFIEYILNKVLMIKIVCSSRISAIKLFQIINTRGLELSLADLIKSSLLSKIEDDRIDHFMAYWYEIENIAERNNETVSDLLIYYGYYVIANKPTKSMYEELEDALNDKEPTAVLYDFKKFVDNLDSILNEKSNVIYSLNYLRDRVYWKTILTTAKMEEIIDFSSFSKDIRNMFYSYWIANYTTAKLTNFTFTLIRLLKNKGTQSKIKKAILKKMKEDKVKFQMRENLNNDVYGSSWLKPSLILIEYNQTDESTLISYNRNLHVDHVLPWEWEKIWCWKNKWSEEQASNWLHKIGNLTLLSGRKNIQASNDSFPNKKKIYKGKGIDGTTSFEISKRILNNSSWTEKNVRRRQKWMITELCKSLGYNDTQYFLN